MTSEHGIERKAKVNVNPCSRRPPGDMGGCFGKEPVPGDLPVADDTEQSDGKSPEVSLPTIPPSPYPPTPQWTPYYVVAQYGYKKRNPDDLDFEKGDRMMVLPDGTDDWLWVRHQTTGLDGYVPANYVAKEDTHESKEWYHGGINRKEAERLLLQPEMPDGSFLIRESSKGRGSLAISIRVSIDPENPRAMPVKHYQIKTLDDGRGYYISRNVLAKTLCDLVAEHSRDAQGLAHVLTMPCRRDKPLAELNKDSWELDRDYLRSIKKLGEGHFGSVWYGLWQNEVEVAIKELQRDTMTPENFLEEAGIMKKCRHDKLVKLFGVCTKPASKPIYIVTEFMVNGDLLKYLREPQNVHSLTEIHLIYVAAQVADGMNYLEQHKMIHRDLAARNVLVGDRLTCKVADFGLARCIQDEEYSPRAGGKFPIKWTAPEAVTHNVFTHKSDVWAFGVLLYELFTYGGRPYPGMSNPSVIEQVQQGYRLPRPKGPREAQCKECPLIIYNEVMEKCWEENPEQRPTFEFLLDFFENYTSSSEGSGYREAVNY